MIEREVWIAQMRRYVRFVADEAAIRRAWVAGEPITSAMDFDELFEQIFDDLDADHLAPAMLNEQQSAEDAAISQFLVAMRQASEAHPRVSKDVAEQFLLSPQWRALHSSAISALQVLQ